MSVEKAEAVPQEPAGRDFPVDRKAIFGWSMFDFANSSFTTVMITAYFSVWFKNTLVVDDPNRGQALWGVCQGISQSIVILSAPLLGALADFSGNKKGFLFITYLMCGLFTVLLGFTNPGQVALGMTLFIIANIAFSSGENFISGFLPEISPPHLMGKISGLAWGMGYIGGIGSLLVGFLIDKKYGSGGASYIWMATGAWFLIGGIPTFLFVKEKHQKESLPAGQTIGTVGFHRLHQTWIHRRQFHQLSRFFWIFTIFISGVTAVISFAGIIAEDVMKFNTGQLGKFLMVVNVTAVAGAWLSGPVADRFGSRQAILLALTLWLVALVCAAMVQVPDGAEPDAKAKAFFWIAGNLVGAAMGATYAASRALVGKFSPESRSGEFFGLWGMFGKLGAVIGPMSYGQVAYHFGTRSAVLMLGLFFAAGFALMFLIDEKEGLRAAEEWERDHPQILDAGA